MSSHVLVVDDDPELRKALGLRLKSAGARTTLASDGEQAMKVIRSDCPDLVLLDLMLPGGSGYVLLEQLSGLPEPVRVPVVVMSGCDPARHEKRTLQAGACAFLRKPITTAELMSALAKHLPATSRPRVPAADVTAAIVDAEPSHRVLVVDDDPDLRKALSVRLRASGYETSFASDALTAVSTARHHPPDVILLDLGLPAGDGFLVMRRLREFPALACIPVIVMTGRDPVEARDLSFQGGAVAFLSKPVDTHALLESLSSALLMTLPE